MDGVVALAIVVGAIALLAFRARGKLGYRDLTSDVRGESELPRRPVTGGYHMGQLGNDLLDDPTGDAGARPREE
jgi:hypothetical protein